MIIVVLFVSCFFPQPAFVAPGLGCDVSAIPIAILLVGACFALQLLEKMK
jgi:hypothetical protein